MLVGYELLKPYNIIMRVRIQNTCEVSIVTGGFKTNFHSKRRFRLKYKCNEKIHNTIDKDNRLLIILKRHV